MKKTFYSTAALLLASMIVLAGYGRAVGPAVAGEVSERSAAALQSKIEEIKKVENNPSRNGNRAVEVTDAELESYVLFRLRGSIPLRIDSFRVLLTPGIVGADTQLTFNSGGTGNPIVDSLVGGTHNILIKGAIAGQDGLGSFELNEVRIDGIPVPSSLIETLVNRYARPRYPDVDLNAPFELPWGIQSLRVETGKAVITY